ncbi:hypothetical protein Pla8534_26200 [Lignipirellula cremea]|uniref:Uncharacterized protein n=1 Tax=Lignipirellula cremea TaxID=2528010 RepID=A0A518DSJ1_9BACT|nr:hypothetical protein Pla8534_26200 [Lignipirellula cremea]
MRGVDLQAVIAAIHFVFCVQVKNLPYGKE